MKNCNKCQSDKIYQTECNNFIDYVLDYIYWCKKCWDKEFEERCNKKRKEITQLDGQLKEESFTKAKWRIEEDGFKVVKLTKKKWYQFWIKSIREI
jgi:hypothetical protein